MNEAGPPSIDFRLAALEHLDALYGYAMALVREKVGAEDLVQETYLRAIRASHHLVAGTHLRGWLFTIMRNVWRNEQRHLHSGPQFIGLEAEEEDRRMRFASRSDNPYLVLVRKKEREEVREAIARLSPAHREVVVLRDIEGFSYQQIAGIIGCPAGTVMSRLARARDQLRSMLGDERAERAVKRR
jgi:RNA polymerase sigma-70 factor (ECF subfamily)